MKQKKILKSGLWISYATFVARFFSLLSNLVLARFLEPSEFGVIGIAYVFWAFFCLFVQDVAGAFINYKGIEKRYVNTALTVSLVMGLCFGVIMVITSPIIAAFFGESALIGLLCIFAFNVFLSSANYTFIGVMTRKEYYGSIANISLISSAARLFFTTGAAWLGFSYWSFAIGDTAFWLFNCILTWIYSKQPYRLKLDRDIRKEVIKFYIGTIGSGFGYYVNANIDSFTVGKILGNASLGIYNLAYQLTMATFSICASVFNQLGMPLFAQLSNDKEQERALLDVVKPVAIFSAILYGTMFLLITPDVVEIVFGEKWIPICAIMPGILISAYFRVINLPLGTMLSAKGRPDINAKVNLKIAPIAVLGFMLGAYLGGVVGVSIAVAIILGIVWAIYWWWSSCHQLGWPLKQYLFPCFLPILIAIPGLVLAMSLPVILRPIAFLSVFLLMLRILVPDTFFQTKNLISSFSNK